MEKPSLVGKGKALVLPSLVWFADAVTVPVPEWGESPVDDGDMLTARAMSVAADVLGSFCSRKESWAIPAAWLIEGWEGVCRKKKDEKSKKNEGRQSPPRSSMGEQQWEGGRYDGYTLGTNPSVPSSLGKGFSSFVSYRLYLIEPK